jgi:predicted lipase
MLLNRNGQLEKVIKVVSGHTTRVILSQSCDDPNTIVVSFRGTALHHNWLNNLKMGKSDFPYAPSTRGIVPQCQVHSGFLCLYEELRKRLHIALRPFILQQSSIILTGHSMGGALATLAAMDLAGIAIQRRINLITYGAPRVGDAQFAEVLVQNVPYIRRVIEENDLVPHFPGRRLGYVHAGPELYYHRRKYFICKDNEDPKCSSMRFPYVSSKAHLLFEGKYYFGVAPCSISSIDD